MNTDIRTLSKGLSPKFEKEEEDNDVNFLQNVSDSPIYIMVVTIFCDMGCDVGLFDHSECSMTKLTCVVSLAMK